jgi:hypothetical protein
MARGGHFFSWFSAHALPVATPDEAWGELRATPLGGFFEELLLQLLRAPWA